MLKTRNHAKQAVDGGPSLSGPLLAVVHYRFPVPSNFWAKRRRDMHTCPHYCRPDGDNLEKFLGDAFNGVLWDDDCQFAWMLRSKSRTQDKEGSTTVYVTQIEDATPDYPLLLQLIQDHIRLE